MGDWQETLAILVVVLAGAHLVRTGIRRIGILLRISGQPMGVCDSCHRCQSKGSHAHETPH